MINLNSEIKNICAAVTVDINNKKILKTRVELQSGAIGESSVSLPKEKTANECASAINTEIMPLLVGVSALEQVRADSIMIALNAARNRSNLGANIILSVSLAICRAAAAHIDVPLYRYIGGYSANSLPIPIIKLNEEPGREFMIIPRGETLRQSMDIAKKVKAHFRKLKIKSSDEESLIELAQKAIRAASCIDGDDVILLSYDGCIISEAGEKKALCAKFINLSAERTVSEVCNMVARAKKTGLKTVISMGNNEFSDDIACDLSVALGIELIEGSLKNAARLINIEKELFVPSYRI